MSELKRGPEVLEPEGLDLSAEELKWVSLVRNLAYESFFPRAARYDAEGLFPHENYADLKQHGLMALRIPKEYGGIGISSLGYMAAMFEIAKGDPSTAMTLNMHCTAMAIIDQLGTEAQKKRLFERVVREQVKFSACGSEHAIKPFLEASLPTTVLKPVPGGYLLRGRKAYCSFGGNADYSLVGHSDT